MRLIETCKCGASLEVIFTAPNSEYSYGEKREETEALKQIVSFQNRHAPCLASNQEESPR